MPSNTHQIELCRILLLFSCTESAISCSYQIPLTSLFDRKVLFLSMFSNSYRTFYRQSIDYSAVIVEIIIFVLSALIDLWKNV